jgi:SAM-dependent methyltransferase
MKDTTKAIIRRSKESGFWSGVLGGYGIDVGCGDDPAPFAAVHFDKKNGDANKLHEYFSTNEFNYLHASHCLEHMDNPMEALGSWIKVVKPRGYLVIVVPDWCLYEGMIWPSRYNPDHKSTWSMWLPNSPAPYHVRIRDLAQFYDVIYAQVIDTNYDYKVGTTVDQTLDPRVEAAIEFIIKK